MTYRPLIDLHRLRLDLGKVVGELRAAGTLPGPAKDLDSLLLANAPSMLLTEVIAYQFLAKMKSLQRSVGPVLLTISPSFSKARLDLATALEWGQLPGQRPEKARSA